MANRKIQIGLSLLVNFCRFLSAVIFTFSGFVKAVDPIGNAYKIGEYIDHFIPSLAGELGRIPLVLSVFQAIFEFLLGVCLFWGIRRKFCSLLLLVTVLLFTALTAYIALFNPVADCGCFGDVIKLSNWQTFYKNLLLLFCAVVILLRPLKQVRLLQVGDSWIVSLYSLIFVFAISLYSIYYLPVIDWGEYKIGTNLAEEQTAFVQRGDGNNYQYVMEKDGVRKVFSQYNYPDSTWTFVKLISPKAQTATTVARSVLSVYDYRKGQDVTDSLLKDLSPSFWLIVPKLETMDEGTFDRINDVRDYCRKNNYNFYVFTASDETIINEWKEDESLDAAFFQADETLLKSMVRANPGLMLIKKGVILNKWSSSNIPDENKLTKQTSSFDARKSSDSTAGRTIRLLLLYLVPIGLRELTLKIVSKHHIKTTK